MPKGKLSCTRRAEWEASIIGETCAGPECELESCLQTTGLSNPCGTSSGDGAIIRAASGPCAAKACGLSLRSTSGNCQKVLVLPLGGGRVLCEDRTAGHRQVNIFARS